VALILRKKGIKHIRPLEGGLEAWRERGYPMVSGTNQALEPDRSPEV
jgi:rhodanese-related sulfurtransferase